MRIISGAAKGLKLGSLGGKKKNGPIRPTSDRARESLFNIIGSKRIVNATVLDLFAGTGALGLESLSRGASFAIFVDKSFQSLQLIHQNISLSHFTAACLVLKRDLNKGLFFFVDVMAELREGIDQRSFDLVFLDPPYDQVKWEFFLDELQKYKLLNQESLVICEDRSNKKLPLLLGKLQLSDQRKYGDTGFWIYTMT